MSAFFLHSFWLVICVEVDVDILTTTMVQKFPNLLDLGEAGTETVSPVLKAYGLVSATSCTNFRSRTEEE